MSAKQVGLAVLIHRALAALHDGKLDEAKGSLYQALDLFRDPSIDKQEIVEFATAQYEQCKIEQSMGVSIYRIVKILEDWETYKPASKNLAK